VDGRQQRKALKGLARLKGRAKTAPVRPDVGPKMRAAGLLLLGGPRAGGHARYRRRGGDPEDLAVRRLRLSFL
jgi:hypothetical protein